MQVRMHACINTHMHAQPNSHALHGCSSASLQAMRSLQWDESPCANKCEKNQKWAGSTPRVLEFECMHTHACTHARTCAASTSSSACRGFLKKRHISQRAHTFLSLIHAWVPDWPKSTQPLFLSPCTHTRTQTRKNTRTHRHTHSCEHERPETKEGKRVIQLRIREQLQEHYTECWH